MKAFTRIPILKFVTQVIVPRKEKRVRDSKRKRKAKARR